MGTLYIVATPIGNLDDISRRALDVLRVVDVIAAEDTRHSRRLLSHYGIDTPLTALHEHNERQAGPKLVARLQDGQSVALISDAGTPLLSDPGYHLIRAAQDGDITVVPVPGASALLAALSASGLPAQHFCFEGFLPARGAARRAYLESLADETRTLVFFEAPHRILDTLRDLLALWGKDREAVLARELTKTFETVRRGTLAQLQAWVAGDEDQRRGEIVLLVRGARASAGEQDLDRDSVRTLQVLLDELPVKQAVRLAAQITGKKRNMLYAFAVDANSKKDAD
ncbi:MAG: 16S rRNA (cytidine(1402)-2'-O)-methyltransferase [Pseudomonadota bacterium]|nr:MAG: 16S rRNA (cytidine(1402)-2'-O)-methyltransferase [Pseudomonadota bacterium]